MSVASVNFFAALTEEPAEEFSTPVTRQSTSTKKADRPPPKADPSKSRPKKKNADGNDAAFKDKTAGRSANKKVTVPENASASAHRQTGQKGVKTDRHSKSGKSDTTKRVNAGWGDNAKEQQDEQAGEEIAKSDLAADAAEDAVADVTPTKTLGEYLSEKTSAGLNISSDRARRQPNEGSDNAQWAAAKPLVKEQLEEGSRKKAQRQKARKEVVTVEPDTDFVPSMNRRDDRERSERPRPSTRAPRSPRSNGPPAKGGAKGPRGPKPTAAKASQQAMPKLDNLPRLG